jgi:hypothetical protein
LHFNFRERTQLGNGGGVPLEKDAEGGTLLHQFLFYVDFDVRPAEKARWSPSGRQSPDLCARHPTL